jgi:hypothetical protein
VLEPISITRHVPRTVATSPPPAARARAVESALRPVDDVTGERWNDYHDALFLPGWFVVGLTAVTPAVHVLRRRSGWTDGPRGLYPACAYDLRATPDRCPECGTAHALTDAVTTKATDKLQGRATRRR